MPTKSKTTPKKAGAKAKPVTLYAQIATARLDADPFFEAMHAEERALGQVMLATGDIPKKDFDRLIKAERRAAETVPTSYHGIEASARWFLRHLARHDGIENCDGDYVVAKWPQTIATALREYPNRDDPAPEAVRAYHEATTRLNASRGDKQDETTYNAAFNALQRTIPTTGPGLARALEAFVANVNAESATGGRLAPDQREWARRLIEAARALP